MKVVNRIILFLTFIMLVACEKSDIVTVHDNDKLLGYWINPVQVEGYTKYERADSFKEDQYGFAFKQHQEFVERKNVGWCGTPPVAYGNYDGSYTMKTDSILNIKVDYWGGTTNYIWRIVSVDDKNLLVEMLGENNN